MAEDQNNMRMLAPQTTAKRTRRPASSDDGGYILAVLLIGMAIAAVWMTASLPAWRQQAQREKELELRFRGEQYARAIALYYVKNRTLPTDIDTLVSQRFLRKKWKDPITNDDFVPVLLGQQQGAGNSGTANGGRNTGPGTGTQFQPQSGAQAPGRAGSPQQGGLGPSGGTIGGISGVMSKSTATSIIIYSPPGGGGIPAQEYDLWQFSYLGACAKISICPGVGGGQNGPRGGGPNNGNNPNNPGNRFGNNGPNNGRFNGPPNGPPTFNPPGRGPAPGPGGGRGRGM